MALEYQLTIDCAEPHVLADWWAETLGWSVEPTDEAFITSMVAQGKATEADTMRHRGALVWRVGAAITHPDRPSSDAGHRILFQQVPEAKTVKNRAHMDVRVGGDGREAAVAALIARGATELYRASQGPFSWVTMADPEGNEFCVT